MTCAASSCTHAAAASPCSPQPHFPVAVAQAQIPAGLESFQLFPYCGCEVWGGGEESGSRNTVHSSATLAQPSAGWKLSLHSIREQGGLAEAVVAQLQAKSSRSTSSIQWLSMLHLVHGPYVANPSYRPTKSEKYGMSVHDPALTFLEAVKGRFWP